MSRSGYSDNYDHWNLIRYHGQVASAIRGKRGQQLIRDLRNALDAMPEKRLIANELESDGDVCALGAVARLRGVDVSVLDPYDYEAVAELLDIAPQLAREVVFENDEQGWDPTPEGRWVRMREWAESNMRKDDGR